MSEQKCTTYVCPALMSFVRIEWWLSPDEWVSPHTQCCMWPSVSITIHIHAKAGWLALISAVHLWIPNRDPKMPQTPPLLRFQVRRKNFARYVKVCIVAIVTSMSRKSQNRVASSITTLSMVLFQTQTEIVPVYANIQGIAIQTLCLISHICLGTTHT